MGVILGGRIGFGTAFGIGIRPGKFVMDIGIINRGFITPGSSKGLIVGIELGLNFNAPREMPVLRVEDL
jgi:hypothetical protein